MTFVRVWTPGNSYIQGDLETLMIYQKELKTKYTLNVTIFSPIAFFMLFKAINSYVKKLFNLI